MANSDVLGAAGPDADAGPAEWSGAPAAPAGLAATPLRALLRRAPVMVEPEASIRDAALLMRRERVSSLLVGQPDRLLGIVTDRDLRNRVIADATGLERPIVDVATVPPLTADLRGTGFDALLLMTRRNVHHVPVMDGTRVVGMISATDLMEQHATSPVFLAGEIHRQTSIEGLQRVSARIGQLQRSLAAADATACVTGQVVTAVTDALSTRLLRMAEERLGPPPVDYAWVAAGSQARCEQTARSDQDNCLILADEFDEARHAEYFQALARFVCDGLNACGFVYCPGAVMAMTDEWRQPQRRWSEYFERWIRAPLPKALMLTCVFFDLRLVHGRASLLDEVRAGMLRQARGNGIFLAYMVSNALSRRPPLSVFGRVMVARSGPQRGKVDLKHLGIVPIVDLARIYALAGGSGAVNTWHRLEVAAAGGEVSPQSARDLRDALELLAAIRIQHQARQIERGVEPDSFVAPAELSNFQRTQLKSAFQVVQRLQATIGQRHQAGRF